MPTISRPNLTGLIASTNLSAQSQANPVSGQGYGTFYTPPTGQGAINISGALQALDYVNNSALLELQNNPSRLRYAQEQYKKSTGYKIVGLKTPKLIVRQTAIGAPYALTDNTDFTSYPDRALLILTNDTADVVVVTGIAIHGMPVTQYTNAYKWSNVNYEDLERRGEIPLVIENEYICTKEQLEDLGDYTVKLAVSNPEYSLSIPGCHYEYNIGDVWHLTLSYTIPGQVSQSENIDTDVEIRSISIDRQVGGIGNTSIVVSPPPGAWSKTTNIRSRLISIGQANLLNNRGNFLTVGSSTWTGQADYYCDGQADEIQIQQAIDFMASNTSGGSVVLTSGTFMIDTPIYVKSNISLSGESSGTILMRENADNGKMIDCYDYDNVSLADFVLDGNKANFTYAMDTDWASIRGPYNYGRLMKARNIICQNYKMSGAEDGIHGLYLFAGCNNLTDCVSQGHEIIVTSGTYAGSLNAFYTCTNMVNCISQDLEVQASGGLGVAQPIGFSSCENMYGCIAGDMTASGGANNIATGFVFCKKITNCKAEIDVTVGRGYDNCSSVQQCQSVDNNEDYVLSYADSGTSNACADTAAGGYNS